MTGFLARLAGRTGGLGGAPVGAVRVRHSSRFEPEPSGSPDWIAAPIAGAAWRPDAPPPLPRQRPAPLARGAPPDPGAPTQHAPSLRAGRAPDHPRVAASAPPLPDAPPRADEPIARGSAPRIPVRDVAAAETRSYDARRTVDEPSPASVLDAGPRPAGETSAPRAADADQSPATGARAPERSSAPEPADPGPSARPASGWPSDASGRSSDPSGVLFEHYRPVRLEVDERRVERARIRPDAADRARGEPPLVHVTIGRVEVRAVAEPSRPSAPADTTAPAVSTLDAYLRRRAGARP